jgi:hypothetical protein
MTANRQIDHMIEAGWKVLDSDFDESAFLAWRKRAADCLKALVGSDHSCTKDFLRLIRETEEKSGFRCEGVFYLSLRDIKVKRV